ncbi:MAG: methylenetetrahydrofolate reductase, partial [Candidatus Eremiobacteraeota bacterium]|nr:methylenetetrahydrofolate reductase [Candidatus Eremiobacteraeota bacterium]MBV8355279.1 methylenetetrahydrofolate reductase [Candidatus Eremiobacteraeota bacterium]
MKITEALAKRRPFFSFEFFPPKSDEGMVALFETIGRLRILEPAFVSITYGAGGSTRTRTVELAKRIRNELRLDVLAHVTCVGATRDELRRLFDELAAAGIENIMALRGDPPKGEAAFVAPHGGFAHASELIGMLAREYAFCIGGACYPEVHPEAPDADTDMAHLVEKARSGADFLTTQLFFENDGYFEFVERARAAGIGVPIIPGIMPITDYR